MNPVREIRSRTVVLPVDNVDTDQIIPARFLVTTSREGLAAGLFADWRFDAERRPRTEVALGRHEAQGGRGFEAVVSTAFADIFRANALKNGLVPVVVDPATHAQLVGVPGAEVAIDLEELTVTIGGRRSSFPLEPFARYCLLNGLDELAVLLSREQEIAAFEAASGSPPWRLS